MTHSTVFDLNPLKPDDLPDPTSIEFQEFLERQFEAGDKLIESMSGWNKHSLQHDGTVQVVTLPSSSSYNNVRKELGVKEFWCGRQSTHSTNSVRPHQPRKNNSILSNPGSVVRSLSQRLSRRPSVPHIEEVHGHGDVVGEVEEEGEIERQARVMATTPEGIYERFRRGLLEYHSENEREYIESMRETECLEVYQKHVAEVWRLTYVTPPPTNPRTFVVLLLSREVKADPAGERTFMNISIPFAHPNCPEKQGGEKSRVRGKYVSVERVKEMNGGAEVEWKMATSSDAGGNIPRFLTNSSLPSKISEDVPSFLGWMVKRFPEGGQVESAPVQA